MRLAGVVVVAVGLAAIAAALVRDRSEVGRSGGDRASSPPETQPTLAGRPSEAVGGPGADVAPASAPPGDALVGSVVDPEGRPVAGARVSLWIDPRASAASGPDGRYALRVPPGEDWSCLRLEIADRRWVAREARQWVSRGEDPRLVVVPACEMRVAVLEASSGRPVDHAWVRSVAGDQVSADSDWARRARHSDEAFTGVDGRASVRAPYGIARVYVTARGYCGAASAPAHVTTEGLDVTVELHPGGSIAGQVLDAHGGGVKEARVHAVGDPIYDAAVRTEADGSFRLEDVPAGVEEICLSVQADGWAPDAWCCPSPEAGRTSETQIILREARTLTGRAVLSDGSPAAGVRVSARPDSHAWFSAEQFGDDPASAVSGPDGSFQLTPVTPGGLYVSSRHGSWHFASIRPSIPQAGPVPEIVLRQEQGGPRGFVVRVLDPSGKPMPAISVDALTRDPDGMNIDRVGWEDTDGLGIARFETGLPNGPVIFVAQREGSLAPCRIEADLGDPALEEAAIRIPAGRASGRVHLPDGSPARVEVVCERLKADGTPDEWMYSATFLQTDEEGRFTIEGLGDAEYSLKAWGPRAPDMVVVGPPSIRAGPTESEWVLTPRADTLATIDLIDAEKRTPLTGARVTFRRGGEAFEEDEAHAGRYRSPPTRSGPHDLHVKVEDHRLAVVPGVALSPGGPAPRVEVVLDPGCVLEGRILLRTTRELADAEVEVSGEQVWAEDGSFRVAGLDPGVAEVVMEGHFVLRTTRSVALSSAENPTRVDFEVEPAGAIRVDAAEPHPEWEEMEIGCRGLENAFQERQNVVPNWDPELENCLTSFGGLAAGRYRVELTVEGKPFRRDVDVVAGKETVVVVNAP